jgi:hypothetical protein
MRRTVLAGLAIALWLPPLGPARAQQPRMSVEMQMPPGRDRPPVVRVGTGVVKGRVVDGATGNGVPRARVTLLGVAAGRLPVVTDGSGAFAFTNLPAGPLTLMVEKATFLQARYPDLGRTFRSRNNPIVLVDGQVLDDVTIPVFRGCSISGRVVDANGDLVEYAQVTAIRVPGPGRNGRPVGRSGSSSNDLGEFRIGRLEPGDYVLQVTPRRMPDNYNQSGSKVPGPQPLPTYYPSTAALDQAVPIILARGQSVSDIDVVLTEGLPAVIAGVVTGLDGQPVTGNGHINARGIVREGFGGFDGSGTAIRPDGTFRMTLPPGEWLIEARVNPAPGVVQQRQEDEVMGIVKVTVAGGAEETVSIVVGRGAMATGRVVFEGGAAPQSPSGQTHVPVASRDGTCRSGPATVGSDWTFQLSGLFGACSSQAGFVFGRWTVKAVMFNGDNLLDGTHVFRPGEQLQNVQVIVTDRRSDVTFRVADENGQPTQEYVALLYPTDKAQWSQAVRTFVLPPAALLALSGRGGGPTGPARAPALPPARRESMMGIRPGEYYAVAVDDMEVEDSRDPAVLERLASSGVRVTVSEGANHEVPLRRVRMADVMRK